MVGVGAFIASVAAEPPLGVRHWMKCAVTVRDASVTASMRPQISKPVREGCAPSILKDLSLTLERSEFAV